MRRLVKLLVLLAAASTLTIACFPTRARRARKLARRSPQPGPSGFVVLEELREHESSILGDIRTLARLTGTGPLLLAYTPYQARGTVKHLPGSGLGLAALLVHPDHRAEISRAIEHGQLPERIRPY